MNILKWLVAAITGSFMPALIFESWILGTPWDTVVRSPLVWVAVLCLPLASGALLFLSSERFAVVVRPAFAVLILHAIGMYWLSSFDTWRPLAGTSLALDLMLIAVLLSSVIKLRAGRFAKATIFWTPVLFGLGIPAALGHSLFVMRQAEALAGDRPYCLQYANQRNTEGYEPARTLFDLSAMNMRTRLMSGGSTMYYWQHHAVLILGRTDRQFFNWSYDKKDFVEEVRNRRSYVKPEYAYMAPKAVCEPSAHYARSLPAWSPHTIPFEQAVGEHRFGVPPQFRPRRQGETFVFDAEGPNFEPYDPYKWRPYTDPSPEIAVKHGGSAELLTNLLWRQHNAPGGEDFAPEFGLRKRQVNRATYYTGHDENDQLIRFIQCWGADTSAKRTCYYAYTMNGLNVALYISDPSQWQAVEQRLQNLMASFEKVPSP